MRLELYLAETARLAQQQSALLEGAAQVLELVRSRAWRFVTDFLQAPLPERLRG